MVAQRKITVQYFSYSRPVKPGDPITALAFLDFTEADISPKDLAEQQRQLGSVMEVRVFEPSIEGFIVDSSSHLTIGEDRAVIFRLPCLKGLLVDVRERYGTGAASLLYHFGVEAGLNLGKAHKAMGEKLGLKDNLLILREISVRLFSTVGYGNMEVVEFSNNPPYGLLRVHNSFECELGRGSGRRFSEFVRGMIAGLSTGLLGAEMFAEEKKCIVDGDAYCEFEVSPKAQKQPG